MPKIDVTRFMEQSGMRKARFGGYEPDDVRAALQALCTEYEQRLGRAEAQARKAEQENAALQQHCQTCLLYTSPRPRDVEEYRMPSSA